MFDFPDVGEILDPAPIFVLKNDKKNNLINQLEEVRDILLEVKKLDAEAIRLELNKHNQSDLSSIKQAVQRALNDYEE
jgi:hypothetical protein